MAHNIVCLKGVRENKVKQTGRVEILEDPPSPKKQQQNKQNC